MQPSDDLEDPPVLRSSLSALPCSATSNAFEWFWLDGESSDRV
jgi:hypothetical protein